MGHSNQDENASQSLHDVNLQGVTETGLIPLQARAVDARSPNPIIGDMHAQKVMDQLNYDFPKTSLSATNSSAVAVRTRFFDNYTRSFLARHPASTILHLGCGLDSRALRVDWGGGAVCWVDVDLPPTLALRKLVMPMAELTRDYRLVGADVAANAAWLEGIPGDRPTAVVMEGLISYMTEAERTALLLHLVEKLDEGEIIMDCISPQLLGAGRHARVEAVRQTGAVFQSAIGDPKQLEAVHERLQLVETVRFAELPGIELLPYAYRFQMDLLSWIPGLRDSVRYLRYRILPRQVS
ncbi:hypothetical protein N0V90_002116 [Kalmusia sp. IMI 367209]|nr:hypothetical protein N0V90_002116 [Kalmusia sp. IMI 367209]